FFSSRRRHTRSKRDWSSDVCSSDLAADDASKVATDYIHDSGGSVTFGKGSSASIVMGNGLTFNGIKNRTVLWSSSATSMASGSRSEERRVGEEGGARE